MPFLRVLRDKRGYETTYLMHWFREGNRQRSRILYVFRTPPGVRVGRDALDPQVIREIQAKYPDIEFDWRALRENQQVVEMSAEARHPRPSARPARRKEEPERPGTEGVRPQAGQTPPVPRREQAAPPQPALVIPAKIEGTTREEQFVFLLRWYLNLRERVPHRTQDPIRREALLGLVERLNPEAWVGETAVVEGLKNAAEALERLSHIFAKRRKRARRPKAGAAAEAPAAAGQIEASDGVSEGEPLEPEPQADEPETIDREPSGADLPELEAREQERLEVREQEPERSESRELSEPRDEPGELPEPREEPDELHEPREEPGEPPEPRDEPTEPPEPRDEPTEPPELPERPEPPDRSTPRE